MPWADGSIGSDGQATWRARLRRRATNPLRPPVFTVLAADSIGTEQKQVVLFDVNHCWHPLLHTLAEMEKAGLVAPTLHQHLKVVDNLEALEQLCQ